MEDVYVTDDMAMKEKMVDSKMEVPVDDYMMPNEMEGKSVNTHLILYIVLGVCLTAGIVLGIIMGKRAANK